METVTAWAKHTIFLGLYSPGVNEHRSSQERHYALDKKGRSVDETEIAHDGDCCVVHCHFEDMMSL